MSPRVSLLLVWVLLFLVAAADSKPMRLPQEAPVVSVVPVLDLLDVDEVLARVGCDPYSADALAALFGNILPELAKDAARQNQHWQEPYLVLEEKRKGDPPVATIIFLGYLGPGSVVSLDTRWGEEGLQLAVRIDYYDDITDGEAFLINIRQTLSSTGGEDEGEEAPATVSSLGLDPVAAYLKCKCDKTGGSACKTAQCDGLKTCTTTGGPTGSCGYNPVASR